MMVSRVADIEILQSALNGVAMAHGDVPGRACPTVRRSAQCLVVALFFHHHHRAPGVRGNVPPHREWTSPVTDYEYTHTHISCPWVDKHHTYSV
ncbi:hypothetical protein DAI22_01g043400 [Oryza sativa Japonica Group]|nr:hypothetical protein DAI22_01g043400 [Oryza sativa Japonica Group]